MAKTDPRRLWLVRALHTAIYLLMASSVFVVLFAGIAGVHGLWLWIAAGLVGVECVVFVGSGMKCPLTAVAAHYGPGVSDTFLPERFTRLTFRIFTPLIVLGAALVAARMLWLGWS